MIGTTLLGSEEYASDEEVVFVTTRLPTEASLSQSSAATISMRVTDGMVKAKSTEASVGVRSTSASAVARPETSALAGVTTEAQIGHSTEASISRFSAGNIKIRDAAASVKLHVGEAQVRTRSSTALIAEVGTAATPNPTTTTATVIARSTEALDLN